MENYEKKYKEALKVMESLYNVVKYQLSSDALLTLQTLKKAFPELCESEDERIRKELIERFKWELKGAEEQDATGCSRQKDIAMFKRGIAWLEKQGEQKHFNDNFPSFYEAQGTLVVKKRGEQKPSWSEEDEEILDGIIDTLDSLCLIDSDRLNWLKSLKDRVQSKQEWGEYDKIQLSEAIQMVEANGTWIRSEDAVKKVSNWLKSIKPNNWKPSEEQMQALNWVAYNYALMDKGTEEKLQSLYNDLKNL